jgi:transposase
MNHYAGMDLHSNNTVIVIIDDAERWIVKRKVPNDLSKIIEVCNPFKLTLRGVVVESTYNWYWLVDGLMGQGFKVHLAHPGKIEGRPGKKHTNDYDDGFHLAHLLRMNNLPEGYIYPKETRGLRDLLRKRGILVKKRTDFLLSIINSINRTTGDCINGDELSHYTDVQLREIFEDDFNYISARSSMQCIHFLNKQIARLEKIILMVAKSHPYYQKLLTVPGIGKTLALTISLEVGDISRFKDRGDFVSYCRGVGSKQTTNGKKKGEKHRKSGNQYLAWAFVEAANFSKRYCPEAKEFYQRKFKESKLSVLAIKALASKLARACYFIMRDDTDFDLQRIFGKPITTKNKGCGNKPKKGTG